MDVRRAPLLTAIYGAVIVLVSVAISALAWQLGRFALLATLLSGFVFVAPLLAVGLYSVSRALEEGRRPKLSDSFRLIRSIPGQAAVFALIQMVILFTWSRSGMMVTAFITLIGFLAVFIGLELLMPWLAYAAWHSYRETLDCSVWPKLPAAEG